MGCNASKLGLKNPLKNLRRSTGGSTNDENGKKSNKSPANRQKSKGRRGRAGRRG